MKISFSPTTSALQSNDLLIPLPGAPEQLRKGLSAVGNTYHLSLDLLEKDFKGEAGEIHSFYHNRVRVILLGMGKDPGFGEILKNFRSFSYRQKSKLNNQLSVSFLFDNIPAAPATWVEAAANGLLLGTYQLGKYKTKPAELHPFQDEGSLLEFGLPQPYWQEAGAAATRGLAIAESQIRIFDLVNAPSNYKRPADLAAWALGSGRQFGFSVQVMDKATIEKTGLHALLAVNQGSDAPPAFIIMEYRPAKAVKKIGLVGKGVTFDTGGLSIKPSTNMHFMKSDMGGAAAVFGSMELAAKLKLPVHLIGIVPATENSVDARSIKPSDVIQSYSGKTIEIIDTDAEGRLILADGLAYMIRHYQPEILIDVATLTGSSVRTLGYHAAALFCNNDQMAQSFYQLGEKSGERVWRLPLWDVYKEDLKSDVADVRNFSGRPIAGAIGAAKFLEYFTEDHPNWTHLDIAGVAFGDSEFASQKSATGFGVRLLIEYLSSFA